MDLSVKGEFHVQIIRVSICACLHVRTTERVSMCVCMCVRACTHFYLFDLTHLDVYLHIYTFHKNSRLLISLSIIKPSLQRQYPDFLFTGESRNT